MISKFPRDLVEEILSRVPLKSMVAVRSTCKTFNLLSKDESFINKHIARSSREKEFLMVTGDFRVYLISANLHKTHDNNFDLSINRKGTLVARENSGEVVSIKEVIHCNGLLLCVLQDIDNMLVVLNPYLCKRRWINVPSGGYIVTFRFGYDKSSCGSYKILMLCTNHYKIYDLSSNSNSWRVINDTPEWGVPYSGVYDVSLKGDLYWCCSDIKTQRVCLACFDFTKERFEPLLPMPYDSRFRYDVSLSSVREEQLVALLMKRWDVLEVWITNKVEPGAVSWRNLFKFDMNPLPISTVFRTFFIVEEEKKIAWVFGRDNRMFDTCIIGENGYYNKMDLRKYVDIQLHPVACTYVPTSVQIK